MGMSRRFGAAIIGMSLLLLLLLTSTAFAQSEADPEPTAPPVSITDPAFDEDSPVGDIIPKPNSGAAPRDAGDRGGALQLALLGLFFLFGVVAVTRVAVAGRAARRRYAATARVPDASRARIDDRR